MSTTTKKRNNFQPKLSFWALAQGEVSAFLPLWYLNYKYVQNICIELLLPLMQLPYRLSNWFESELIASLFLEPGIREWQTEREYRAKDKVHRTMRPIDTMETGPGASSALRTADGAQRHNHYSLHYKWLKQSRGPAEATASGETMSR